MALTCLGSAKTPQINLFKKKACNRFLYMIYLSHHKGLLPIHWAKPKLICRTRVCVESSNELRFFFCPKNQKEEGSRQNEI